MGSNREKVAVLMSGGVDSSLAAALLLEEGCEVVGITFLRPTYQAESHSDKVSCDPDSAEQARQVTQKLGIDHQVIEVPPFDIFEELFDNAHLKRPAPDYSAVLFLEKEAN